MTGARGTPLVSRAAMTGMTPQEQRGLSAPTSVAMETATMPFPLKDPLDAPRGSRALYEDGEGYGDEETRHDVDEIPQHEGSDPGSLF
jgi:hypothetical protein